MCRRQSLYLGVDGKEAPAETDEAGVHPVAVLAALVRPTVNFEWSKCQDHIPMKASQPLRYVLYGGYPGFRRSSTRRTGGRARSRRSTKLTFFEMPWTQQAATKAITPGAFLAPFLEVARIQAQVRSGEAAIVGCGVCYLGLQLLAERVFPLVAAVLDLARLQQRKQFMGSSE